MGIINITPDSFSGDGVGMDLGRAIERVESALRGEADLLDIGAESTRPGHEPVSAAEELNRLLPVLGAIRPLTSAPISVDTSKAAVAAAAIEAGANLINDVRGFTADPELADVVAAAGLPAILMHDIPPDRGEDLVASVVRELSRRIDRAVEAGIALDQLIIDPGFGFGKDWRQNLILLRRLAELRALGRPILAGLSRKSTIGRVLGLPPGDRLEGTLATTALAIVGGADVVRVHDVAENVRVARMTDAVVRHAPAEPKSWPDLA
jgi:dihydropteroate synthase